MPSPPQTLEFGYNPNPAPDSADGFIPHEFLSGRNPLGNPLAGMDYTRPSAQVCVRVHARVMDVAEMVLDRCQKDDKQPVVI